MRIDVVRCSDSSGMDEARHDDDLSATGGDSAASLVGSRRMLFEKIVTDSAAPADRNGARKNRVSRSISSESVHSSSGTVNSVVHSDDRVSRSISRVSIRTLPLNDRGGGSDDDDGAGTAGQVDVVTSAYQSPAKRSPSSSPSPERGEGNAAADNSSSLLDDPAFAKRISYHHAVFSHPKLILPRAATPKTDAEESLKEEPAFVTENDGEDVAVADGRTSRAAPVETNHNEDAAVITVADTSTILEVVPAVVEDAAATAANVASALDSETNTDTSDSPEDVTNSEDLNRVKDDRSSNLSSSRNNRESTVVSIVRVTKTLRDPDYPDDLNPFGDEDEQPFAGQKESSTNPFGSDSESEPDAGSGIGFRNRAVVKTSTNPFGSDSESDEGTSQPSGAESGSSRKTPVPLPRTMRKPVTSPQPSPRPSMSQQHSSNDVSPATSCHNLQLLSPCRKLSGNSIDDLNLTPRSSGSVALRKKKPAPPPPPLLQKTQNEENIDSNRNSIVEQIRNTNDIPSSKAVSPANPAKSVISPWKNKKGPAPARPIPLRRPVKEMPVDDINTELTDIEVRQHELERQGEQLEQMIRERTEAESAESPAVEEMVLQLFELVNEKNELFRRRSELTNMRKMHNLEKEHAELEYQIRCLMLRPESNKTDSDKAKEEELIKKLLETVERRNEIIEAMEKDRQRETAEDQSVTTQLGIAVAKPEKKSEKKSKKGKKEKNKEGKLVDGKSHDSEKHSPSKLIKQKFMTLRHSAKKLHSKGSELEV